MQIAAPGVALKVRKERKLNLSLELDRPRARIQVTGYLSLQAGENLSVLLRDLGQMEIVEICLDISQCSPVCVGALEALLDRKFQLDGNGVRVVFSRPPLTVSKVFQIMGLQSDGELRSGDPGQQSFRRSV